MLIIAKNAEHEFIEKLNACVVNNPTIRCLYLRLSSLNLDFKDWFPRFAYEFSTFFDDENLALYVCQDHDVFVIGRILTHKKFEQFLTHLTPKLTPALPKELASLFEVGVDWARLKHLCKTKIQNQSARENETIQARKEDVQAVSRNATFGALDRDLISSLSMRRENREGLEVMVVEDDMFSQKLIKNALEDYTLTLCADGQGAVMNYVGKAPDVLFLDIGLPDIDGHQVLKKVFDIDPDAYVVMFSGNGSRDNILKALQSGAKGFVGKPFTKDKLVNYIEQSPYVYAKQQAK